MNTKILNRQTKIVPAQGGGAITVLQPDLRFDGDPEHPADEVRKLLERHAGAANAITIEMIAEDVFHTKWFMVLERRGFAHYPYRARIQREIKEIVQGLRGQGYPIGSSRGKGASGGYYWITSPAEQESTLRPFFDQAVSMLTTCAKMTGLDMGVANLLPMRRLLGSRPEEVTTEAQGH